jgi:hypothetical protein
MHTSTRSTFAVHEKHVCRTVAYLYCTRTSYPVMSIKSFLVQVLVLVRTCTVQVQEIGGCSFVYLHLVNRKYIFVSVAKKRLKNT